MTRTTEEQLQKDVEEAVKAIDKATMKLTGYGENNTSYLQNPRKLIAELAAKVRESEWDVQFANASFAGKMCMNRDRKKRNKLLRDSATPPKKEKEDD